MHRINKGKSENRQNALFIKKKGEIKQRILR